MNLLSTMARVVATAACLACAMLLPGHALAKEYGHYDIKMVLVPAASPGTGGRLDIGYLDRMMRDIGEHASNYPPRFDSLKDQQRAQRDVGSLMGMLDAGFGTSAPPELLLRMGILGSFGHNLQIPNAAGYAQARFTKLLEANPANPMANYHHGQLLSGTGRVKEALPYLTKAKDKGVVPALYALGMVHLAQGDKAKAIEMLSAYQQAQPADQSVGKLIQGIRDGKVEVKQVGGEMMVAFYRNAAMALNVFTEKSVSAFLESFVKLRSLSSTTRFRSHLICRILLLVGAQRRWNS